MTKVDSRLRDFVEELARLLADDYLREIENQRTSRRDGDEQTREHAA